MASNIEEKIAETLKALPPEKQEEVLKFAETLASEPMRGTLSIFQHIDDITAQVPDEEWERLPKDASLNVDHYLYGAPKK